ncbi:glutamine synthetase family protein [Aeromicrobium sp. P5_D10]
MTLTPTSLGGMPMAPVAGHGAFGPMSLEQLRAEAAAGTVDAVMLITPDNHGRCLSERVPTDRFLRDYEKLGAFKVPLMLWGLDIEQNYRGDLEHVGGMSSGAADVPLVPDMTTIRRLPWLPNTPTVICDPTLTDGSPLAFAPRQILKTQLERLESLGVTIQAATELEFYLFDESYEAAWDAGHRGLTASTRHHAAYDAIAAIKAEPFINEVIRQMDMAGVLTEGYSQEYGFGQQEINLAHTGALEMADRHFLYKFGVKSIAAHSGVSATFMAKWAIDGDGSSCHIHTSLWDLTGTTAIGDQDQFGGYVAGLAQGMADSTLLYAPTVNSYRRFMPHSFAPTVIAVGDENRTCSLRLVGSGKTRRVENRVPGADVNPYVALGAMAACGANGIESGLSMPRLETGDMYSSTEAPRLATSLQTAIERFDQSVALRGGLGAEVHAHLLALGRAEQEAFLTETVTDWEKRRFFERA